MSLRGSKPKAKHLHIVEGTLRTGRHDTKEREQRKVIKYKRLYGPIVMPTRFNEDPVALDAWNSYIKPAFWLDRAREAAAIGFCELFSEFTAAPREFSPAKHGRMLRYMSELGLTDERNRVTHGEENEEDTDEHFGD